MSITTLLSTVMVDVKIDDAKQYTTIATRFDGRDDAPVQCPIHCPMGGSRASLEATGRRHGVSICSISSWRTTGLHARKKWRKKHHTCWPFWSPWWCTGTIPGASPDTRGGPGLQQKPLVDATGWVLRAIVGSWTKNASFSSFFIVNLLKKGTRCRQGP